MRMSVLRGFIYLVLLGVALGDVYMHSPRGSNDRLNEQTADRTNANRLFNSQNNAKGGYCINTLGTNAQPPSGPMQYVEGSILPVEWTNQHSCGNEQGTCNMVIQYMCTEAGAPAATLIRDGTSTNSIQDQGANGPTAQTATGVYTYGMNENKTYYDTNRVRQRNRGLFTADQNLNANTAQNTRQNPGGTTYGYEIQEERDYYPYWHPSPWKDVAVLTDDTSLCGFYQSESGNVKAKNLCSVPTANNNASCVAAGGTWLTIAPHGLPAPACVQTDFTRDNHLGNSVDGTTPNITMIVPTAAQEACVNSAGGCACVLRLRYNISTGENNLVTGKFLDSRNNSQLSSDPTVTVEGKQLTLAFNTAQTGRTFQDRSFTFNIVSRASVGVAADAKIYNLNVRGKRGNIVEVYPAVEYDYVPSKLVAQAGDYIHPQWVGCDNNPQDNEGEGTKGTDRSNIVELVNGLNTNIPKAAAAGATPMFDSSALRQKLAYLGQGVTAGCVTTQDQQNPNNCAKLNQAGPYFNAGVIRLNNTGAWAYVGTRNNNFSNRSQKGELIVQGAGPNSGAIAAIVAGSVAGAGALAGGVIMLL